MDWDKFQYDMMDLEKHDPLNYEKLLTNIQLRLKVARETANYTQAELAEKLNRTRDTVLNLEKLSSREVGYSIKTLTRYFKQYEAIFKTDFIYFSDTSICRDIDKFGELIRKNLFGFCQDSGNSVTEEESLYVYGPRNPLQRRARVEHFTGRKKELDLILRELCPGCVISICGPAGIGKSALANEAIWALTQDNLIPSIFPDGIIFHSFYGRPAMASAFEHIIRSFDENACDTSFEAVFRLLSRKRSLLVLDGTEEADHLDLLLQIRGECSVIITTRIHTDISDYRLILRPLDLKNSRNLIEAYGRKPNSEYEETCLTRICELTDGLPLALKLIGSYLNQTEESFNDFLIWLQEDPFGALQRGDQRKSESVRILIDRSIESLSDSAKEILSVTRHLAISSFSSDIVAVALPDIDIRHPLNELKKYGIFINDRKRHKLAHSLIYNYVREEFVVNDTILRRLSAYLLEVFTKYHILLSKNTYDLDNEIDHVLEVMRLCSTKEEFELTIKISSAVDKYFDNRGFWIARQKTLEMGLEAALFLDDSQTIVFFLVRLGDVLNKKFDSKKAIKYSEEALRICHQVGLTIDQGKAMENMGLAYFNLNEYEDCIEFYNKAMCIYKEYQEYNRMGVCFRSIGEVHRSLGDFSKALEYYNQALTIHRRYGDAKNESITLAKCSRVCGYLGKYEDSMSYISQAKTIDQESMDRRTKGTLLRYIAAFYYKTKQYDKAVDNANKSYIIARDIGDKYSECASLSVLCSIFRYKEDYMNSIKFGELALSLSKEIGDIWREGYILGNLSYAYNGMGDFERSVEYGKEGLLIACKIGNPLSEAYRMRDLGLTYKKFGHLKQARELLEKCFSAFEQMQSGETENIKNILMDIDRGALPDS